MINVKSVCLLTEVQREVETGRSVADVGVCRRVNSKQKVVDQLQQIHVWRRPEHLLDDSDERQTHILRDGGQVLVPMLLETIETQLVSEESASELSAWWCTCKTWQVSRK